ncbi:hypothetical protein KDL01_02330 [Actinospica durhamensis]|uniref:Uncharacterized protein n=1 Tax=Actinospica durhamensis TaxID=1508375 RepID=A0A941IR98_9ACTN|nr:hypothetical protein [Actinospica durhamensis]MBR7832076.1 hypothetical protein [Actinospica durhamensis]
MADGEHIDMPAESDGRWPFLSPENWIDAIEDALIQPFPTRMQRHEAGSSTPSHHELILQCSEEFWEERSAEVFEAAEAEVEKGRQELSRQLAVRWGGPETLDLERYFQPAMDGLLPEPLAYLGIYALHAFVWCRPEAGRWLALAIVKHDTELAYELVAVVGELDSLVEPPVT